MLETRLVDRARPSESTNKRGVDEDQKLLDKDELSLEEALELRELARKVIKKNGDRIEAWKLHLYASMKVGFARKRESGKEKEENESKPK